MLEHVREEQASRLLGHGIFLGGNEVCHLAKLIHHHHDGGKLTMKSMDTLSHNASRIDNGCNNPTCFFIKCSILLASHTNLHVFLYIVFRIRPIVGLFKECCGAFYAS